MLQELYQEYSQVEFNRLGSDQLKYLREKLQTIGISEIVSKEDARKYVEILAKFRKAIAEFDKLHGDNYPEMLKSLLSVGEDGLYSNNLRFIFELIQNVDDCDYENPSDCSLDIWFDFNTDRIVLTYNETGFTPFNVFSITGIAEAAKNISNKEEIGEKGIGFKSVFGVADRVLIESGWFSFSLYKENFTIPRVETDHKSFQEGTKMTLFVPNRALRIYEELRIQYCQKDAIFSSNPILFLNKLTHLKLYYDSFRSMDFTVARVPLGERPAMLRESNVTVAVKFGEDPRIDSKKLNQEIKCVRYSRYCAYDEETCKSRYGLNSKVGSGEGKKMLLQVLFPLPEFCKDVGNGGLYSFLPTKIGFTVPVVCHIPFKLDASREFVDPQDNNIWFQKSCEYMRTLLDDAYYDYRHIVKEEIIRYIPTVRNNIIAINNGKENCLRFTLGLDSKHFSEMPLLMATDGKYHRMSEVFSFPPIHLASDPCVIANLLGQNKALFMLPEGINPREYGIQVVDNPLGALFQSAMDNPGVTEQALNILCEESYEYKASDFSQYSEKILAPTQIESVLKHEDLRTAVNNYSAIRIRKVEKCLFYAKANIAYQPLDKILFGEFEIDETPRQVARYLISVKSRCACLDIPEHAYLPCSNLLVLSKKNPSASFSSFCYDIDSKSNFAVRLRMKEASRELDLAVEESKGTDQDFLELLRDNRRFVKDALGVKGYRSYIDLINRSGIDRNRFLQELLQNADDCLFPKEAIPSFKLEVNDGRIVVTYNECGFTRANIRAITALGESTKNNLLADNTGAIGEKGIGFKSIFKVASAVTISSGDICFRLTSEEPTIPKPFPGVGHVPGTRMEIILKSREKIPAYQDKDIVSLCLCLRKLRRLEINQHTITIDERDNLRTITVNNRPRVFRKYHHSFSVLDAEAIAERQAGIYKVLQQQDIYCYVPSRTMELDYCIYSGLPTKHRLNVPMAIDAPFMLTTSREQIDPDSKKWNGIVLREMYKAIIKVMHASKAADRIGVLRFLRYNKRVLPNNVSFSNNLSDNEYVNTFSYIDNIREEKLLATYDTGVFASADSRIYRFPDAVTRLLNEEDGAKETSLDLSMVLDERSDAITSKELKEHLNSALDALRVKTAPFNLFSSFLAEHAIEHLNNAEYRESLYSALEEAPPEYHLSLQTWPIIPVYDQYGATQFVPWAEDTIYVKRDARKKTDDYEILNESILPKSRCEKILGVNINEMNQALEQHKYNDRLGDLIRGKDMDYIYNILIREHSSGNLRRNESYGLLLKNRELIPLKNGKGEIVDTELFLCDQQEDYFPVPMIRQKVVHKECSDFAKELRCEQLCNIHYEDLEYDNPLTADDIECLQDSYFLHSEEILRGFYRNNLISADLVKEYELSFLALSGYELDSDQSSFPEEPAGNLQRIREHVAKILQNPATIKSVRETRSVKKVVTSDGRYFELGYDDARAGALKRYSAKEGYCFCQMCRQNKPNQLIEVNNIEPDPHYYIPELRLALCLECSKNFEARRNNAQYRERFIEAILRTRIDNQPTISISMGENQILFTGKHLAEIQAIFQQKEKLK